MGRVGRWHRRSTCKPATVRRQTEEATHTLVRLSVPAGACTHHRWMCPMLYTRASSGSTSAVRPVVCAASRRPAMHCCRQPHESTTSSTSAHSLPLAHVTKVVGGAEGGKSGCTLRAHAPTTRVYTLDARCAPQQAPRGRGWEWGWEDRAQPTEHATPGRRAATRAHAPLQRGLQLFDAPQLHGFEGVLGPGDEGGVHGQLRNGARLLGGGKEVPEVGLVPAAPEHLVGGTAKQGRWGLSCGVKERSRALRHRAVHGEA
jgi:hypothetical protein